MFERGKIILVPFPFTNLSATKVRPALIVSSDTRASDVIVVFITSVLTPHRQRTHVVVRDEDPKFGKTGLRITSIIRCEKLATLDRRIVLGELGSLDPALMRKTNIALRHALGL